MSGQGDELVLRDNPQYSTICRGDGAQVLQQAGGKIFKTSGATGFRGETKDGG